MSAPAIPFLAGPSSLDPAWIDYNGHLNMAYYHVLFDTAVDAALAAHGFGEGWRAAAGATVFTVEAHVRYRAEVPPEAVPTVAVRLAGYDSKRLHVSAVLTAGPAGSPPSADTELLLIRIDAATRRTAAFTDAERDRLRDWMAAEAALPPPDNLGRAVRLPAGAAPSA